MTDELDEILEAYANQVYSASPDFSYQDGLKFMRADEAKQAIQALLDKERQEGYKKGFIDASINKEVVNE